MSDWKVDIRVADIVGAVLLLGITVFAYYTTTTWIPPVLPGDPGAAFFPRIALGVIFLFSLILLFQRAFAMRKALQESSPQTADDNIISIDVLQFIVAALFSGAVVAGMEYIGFEPAAFTFLFILLGWRTGRWMWSFITSIIAVAIMYFVFVAVLTVRLPLLFLPKYFSVMSPF